MSSISLFLLLTPLFWFSNQYFYFFSSLSCGFLADPLEQFNINNISCILNFYAITTLTLSFVITCLVFSVLCFFFNNSYVNKGYLVLKEGLRGIILFIRGIMRDNIKGRISLFYPLFICLFFFIFLSNLLGMIPFTYAVSSSLIIILFLAFTLFFSFNLIGIITHKTSFIQLFLPPGIMKALLPFIILIEIISYFARIFSLAIRLFANIVAGHTLLKILSELTWFLLSSHYSFFFVIVSILLLLIITSLELVIAGLQAYIFLVLTCIYLNDAINLH